MDISVIIPTIDEEDNLEDLIFRIKIILSNNLSKDNFEIIVVDGGSKDNTQAVATRSGAIVIQQKLPGYGAAIKEGFENARGDFVLTMDADFSHDPVFIQQLLSQRNNAHMIIASRYIEKGQADMSFLRKILSILLNRVFALVLKLPYRDLSSGFRLYNKRMLKRIHLTSNGYEILEEIILKFHANAWAIRETPFHYYARKSGKSHVKFFKFGVSYLKALIKMWKMRYQTSSAGYKEKRVPNNYQ